MASLTQWTWVWADSGSWWWTGRPGMLQFMVSQRVGHDWATELNYLTTHWASGSVLRLHMSVVVLYWVGQSCLTLCNPIDWPARLLCPWGFSQQEYWSRLPFPPPGDLPSPGIEPMTSALAGGFFTTSHLGRLFTQINLPNTSNKPVK